MMKPNTSHETDICDSATFTALMISYAVCTTLLVSVHLLALMMSTCILPHMEVVTSVHSLASIDDSPHEDLRFYIELSWFFSTVLGLLLFLGEIAIVFWIKVINQSQVSGFIATAILIPVFVVFIVFTFQFYRKLTIHHLSKTEQRFNEIERTLTAQMDDSRMENGAFGSSSGVGGGTMGLTVDPSMIPLVDHESLSRYRISPSLGAKLSSTSASQFPQFVISTSEDGISSSYFDPSLNEGIPHQSTTITVDPDETPVIKLSLKNEEA